MHSRIKQVREHFGLSQTDFGKRLGISRDAVSNIEYDRLKRPEQKEPIIKLICREFGVDEIWLRTGEGNMFLELSHDDEIAAYVARTLSDKSAVVQQKFLLILSRLSPECLAELEKVADEILSGAYEKDREQ